MTEIETTVYFEITNDTSSYLDTSCVVTAMYGTRDVNDGFMEGVVSLSEPLAPKEVKLNKTNISIKDISAYKVDKAVVVCKSTVIESPAK